MGLFNSWKKKGKQEDESLEDVQEAAVSAANGIFGNPADFVCEIKEVLPLKDQGSVVVGEVLYGELASGSKVAYTTENGRAIFNCTVKAIEQANVKVKKAAACYFGIAGPIFSFVIPEFAPNAFQKGNYLYQQAEEGKELTELQKKYEECRLSQERKQELTELAKKQELTQEEIDALSIQEMIFTLYTNRVIGQLAGAGNDPEHPMKKKETMLYDAMLSRVRNAEEIYMLYNKETNYPFINLGMVDIFSKREYAELAVMYYAEQFRNLEVRAMKPMPTRDAKEAPVLILLYYLGLERIMLDNGLSRAMLQRGALLPPPDYSKLAPNQTPVENPVLRSRILDFFQEVRWKVNYEGRAEAVKAKEDAMLKEIASARFMVPMKYEGMSLKPGENQLKIKPDTRLMFAAIKNNEDESFSPAFTDMPEFGKLYSDGEWAGMALPFKEVVRLAAGKGIVINPAGENLVLNPKAVEAVMNRVKELEEQTSQEAAEAEEETEA